VAAALAGLTAGVAFDFEAGLDACFNVDLAADFQAALDGFAVDATRIADMVTPAPHDKVETPALHAAARLRCLTDSISVRRDLQLQDYTSDQHDARFRGDWRRP
jgi:hypothetical protein